MLEIVGWWWSRWCNGMRQTCTGTTRIALQNILCTNHTHTHPTHTFPATHTPNHSETHEAKRTAIHQCQKCITINAMVCRQMQHILKRSRVFNIVTFQKQRTNVVNHFWFAYICMNVNVGSHDVVCVCAHRWDQDIRVDDGYFNLKDGAKEKIVYIQCVVNISNSVSLFRIPCMSFVFRAESASPRFLGFINYLFEFCAE